VAGHLLWRLNVEFSLVGQFDVHRHIDGWLVSVFPVALGACAGHRRLAGDVGNEERGIHFLLLNESTQVKTETRVNQLWLRVQEVVIE